ncbi:lantibiotic dehydratase [Streptomyces rectiverticillatus]|uniref:lantibiotic dehydratase n=1 Tax=Streptomyces rectiverticillatus TaxID=173860 RepID=UPI0015C38B99|nr:lantibiotic dehydratase [Streptomyces rectiverticillatus]QLE70358.1 lantibiotic dehydratase [Streptomyces rectiverticillatus]
MTDTTSSPSHGAGTGSHKAGTVSHKAGTGHWSLSPYFVLRVAGLPVESVQALRCPATVRWAERVLREEERLRSRGAALSDRLHPLVKAAEDDGARRLLLRLRRDVFNGRLPGAPEQALALLAAGDAGAAEDAARWVRDRRALDGLLAEGAPLLAAETTRTRTALRGLLGEERLRLGLLLASPELEERLDAYIGADPGGRPDKRLRKAERSALAYLYRTACKTSPFSTFTAVALGRFTEGADGGEGTEGVPGIVRVPEEWTGHPRLNVVVLARLAELIAADPGRRGDLPVALSSGWRHDEDRIRYVRRSVTAGDDGAAVTFDAARDRLFFLRRSGTLEKLLALFGERPQLRYRDLARWLAEERGAGPDECERYLTALLDLGMVQIPCLRTDVHDADPLRAFRDALQTLDRPWAARLAEALERPIDCIGRYAAAGPEPRRELLAELRQSLTGIQRDLGAVEPTLPRTLLYEDVRAGSGNEDGDTGVVCDLRPWSTPATAGGEGPLETLRSLERILPAFDLTLPQRITLKGFFVARYGSGGRCEDLLKLVHDFHEDFYDQYLTFTARRKPFDAQGDYVPEPNWLGLPGITAVDAARQEWASRMRRLWDTARGAEEVRVHPETVEAVAGRLAGVAPRFAPQSHFLQLVRRDGEALAVLNQSYGGFAFPFSRFTHCFDGEGGEAAGEGGEDRENDGGALSTRIRRTAAGTPPEGAVFAEITGGAVTSNLNLHGRLTDYRIVCPGEDGGVPQEGRIALDDLYVEHDVQADRLVLRSRRLDREVVPVYLGYLVPLALPEIPRTLLLLSPTSMAPLDVWGGVPEGEPDDGVTSRPRVRCGGLVLSRRSWTAPAAALPAAGGPGGGGDAGLFLQWQRWRVRHGLPRRVFATVTPAAAAPGADRAKPQYVDFDSRLSLTALEGLLKDPADRVVLREALPGEDELHAVSVRGTHMAELAVETLRTPRHDREGTGAPT